MVRYSSVNFISKPDYSIGFMLYDLRDAIRKSAVGMTHMIGNRTIYGYVDCTRDANGLVGLLLLLVTYSLTWTRFMMIGG
ncbi:unnamed protein product [Camellia sinensis]